MRVLSTPPLLAAAALLAVAVTACTPTGTATPSPAPPAATTPAAASPTPSQDQLVRQTQAAYQVAFDEFERLSREGGADQPSAKMLEVEQDLYLKQDMALLQDQKKTGYRVEGKVSTAKSRSAAGSAKGDSDPRLTLQICEDRRESYSVNPDGRRVPDRLSQGYAYAKVVDGRVKLVNVNTSEVERCDW